MTFILKMEKDVRVPLRLIWSHKAFVFVLFLFWEKETHFKKISQSKQKEIRSNEEFIPGNDPTAIAQCSVLITGSHIFLTRDHLSSGCCGKRL